MGKAFRLKRFGRENLFFIIVFNGVFAYRANSIAIKEIINIAINNIFEL
jgi:hypothetical protein